MANIKINSNPTREQYTASASQTVFSYTFPIKEDADLNVYKRAATAAPDDAGDLLTLTADYTVSGAGSANGGSVTLTSGAAAGDIVTIVGNKTIDRNAIYDQSVTLKKSDLNNDFNDNVMYDKQIKTLQNEITPKYNESESIGPTKREGNLKLPILNEKEIWIGRGNDGDNPDDITTLNVGDFSTIGLLGVDYVVGTDDPLLGNAQALGNLSTGLMKNTVAGGTGTVSIATAGTDYYAPGGTDVSVADGGTGRSSSTAYAVICGGTTSSGPHQSVASVGSSGQVLTSNGSGSLPTFQDIVITALEDSTFRIENDSDDSKKIAFDASGISTSTVRTITMADQDIDLTPNSGSFQSSDAGLTDISGLAKTNGNIIVGDGSHWVAESGSTARVSLGLEIGADVQAYDDTLQDIADGGEVDFGGFTSFEIPNGAAPTVNAAGEMAVDTSISGYSGLIKYHDGTEELAVVAMPPGNLSTTNNHVVAYDATNQEFKMIASPGGGGSASDGKVIALHMIL